MKKKEKEMWRVRPKVGGRNEVKSWIEIDTDGWSGPRCFLEAATPSRSPGHSHSPVCRGLTGITVFSRPRVTTPSTKTTNVDLIILPYNVDDLSMSTRLLSFHYLRYIK